MFLGIMGAAACGALGVVLASGQAAQAPRPQMSEEVFKNVQILKGIPVDEFMDTMGMFAAALSLNCIDCHTPDSVGTWDNFAKETPLKQTSRKMMNMVNAINKDNFSGVRAVTCYSCHRGDMRAKPVPNLAAQYAVPVQDAVQLAAEQAREGAEHAEEGELRGQAVDAVLVAGHGHTPGKMGHARQRPRTHPGKPLS